MQTHWKIIMLVFTYFIWLAIMGVLIPKGPESANALFLMAIAQVIVLTFFYIVTRTKGLDNSIHSINVIEKSKASADPDAKMRLLLEMMDEDERYAFKQAMKERMLSGSRDGELNYDADSLGALLDEDDYPHRRKQ